MQCRLCPRSCGTDRSNSVGVCGVGTLKIARAGLHFGEEPCITGTNGSGTIFFSGCNLKCVFCQNTPISSGCFGKEISRDRLKEIIFELSEKGAHNINLVTPTHFADVIADVLSEIKPQLHIPVVYNCGGYESVDTLKMLSGLVDIYLPDFKYADNETALEYSKAENYPETAKNALYEMFRQRGKCVYDENGIMTSGVIVRHLVLPNHRKESMRVLDIIADTVPVEDIKISLMRQYTPCYKALEIKALSRKLTTFEYEAVTEYALSLGFDGYTQGRGSDTLQMTPEWDLSGT